MLYHPNGLCLPSAGVSNICAFLVANDGTTPNTTAQFMAWINDPNPVKFVCPGNWLVNGNVAFPMNNMLIKGYHQQISYLRFNAQPGSPAIWLQNAVNSKIEGIGINATNGTAALEIAITGPGQSADSLMLQDVVIAGTNNTTAALYLDGAGDINWKHCRVFNSTTVGMAGIPAVRLVGSGGQDFYSCEIHNYIPWSTVISCQDTGRLRFFSGYIDNSAGASMTGSSYMYFGGYTENVAFYGTLLSSDQNSPPLYAFDGPNGQVLHNFYLDPVTVAHIPAGHTSLFRPGVSHDGYNNNAYMPSDDATKHNNGIRVARTRAFAGRDFLDSPTVGMVYNGHPYAGAMNILFNPPFPTQPHISITNETLSGVNAGSPRIVSPSTTGFILEGDQEVNIIAIGEQW